MTQARFDPLVWIALAPACLWLVGAALLFAWTQIDHESALAWTPAMYVHVHCFGQEGWTSHWFEMEAAVEPFGRAFGLLGIPPALTAGVEAHNRENRLLATMGLVANIGLVFFSVVGFLRW